MKRQFNSLRHKLLGVVMLTALTAVLVTSAALVAYDLRSYQRSWINDLNTQTELLGSASAAALQFDDADAATEDLSVLRFRDRVRTAAIYNARGALFASYVRPGAQANFPELPGEDGIQIGSGSMTSFKRIVANGEILGTVYILADYDFYTRLRTYAGIASLVTLIALLVAAVVSFRLQSVIIGPVLSISEVARQVVTSREYSQRARKISDDEVGDLVDAFNNMLDEIEGQTKALEASNMELGREVSVRRQAEQEVLRLNTELENRVRERTTQLEVANGELEAFCYSVSHDLRAPLRAIDGFSQALVEDFPASAPEKARGYLDRIRSATQRMGQLIEDLLNLSRLSRIELGNKSVDLSAIAQDVVRDLQQRDTGRNVDISVWEGMLVNGDPRLLRAALENLLANAWKFTSKTERARIEVGSLRDGQRTVYFVRDNGVGFDMAYADKLFGAFQRLHGANEFPGTGIGLATVQRIIHRHGGRIWVDAQPGKGAVFFFTLSSDNSHDVQSAAA